MSRSSIRSPSNSTRVDTTDAPRIPTRKSPGIVPLSLLSHAKYAIPGDKSANTVHPTI